MRLHWILSHHQHLQLNSDRMTVEGNAVDNEFETLLVFTEPTADRTITFKNATEYSYLQQT